MCFVSFYLPVTPDLIRGPALQVGPGNDQKNWIPGQARNDGMREGRQSLHKQWARQ